ncbi:igLON family member 5 isoform X2 [Bombyx mori]|uniref:Ig-like domain-containing protein n=1 Tax=Bombyx mori TaxID=7091 RepID=A0A8R2G6T6_BOMMO|nr:igLON family member 5 isoform X2 [Bombyx mori]
MSRHASLVVQLKMWSLNICCLILMCTHLLQCERQFKSVPVTVKSYKDETVLLPCYLDESDVKPRVRWYKDGTLLGDSKDPGTLLPPRVQMHANFSIQINEIRESDTAAYTCEVIRPEPWGPIRQTHSVEVQYPPTVMTIPDDGFLEVKKGEFVDIGCETTGFPPPVVEWRKDGEVMEILEHRSRIRFKASHRMQAGAYECIANNGVGSPVAASIRVIIQDAPVVIAQRTFVHTAPGLRAALLADVQFAVPPARTAWYRDGRPVNTDDRVLSIAQGSTYQLIFRSIRTTDLGNYTFRAENKLGMADVSYKLTGVPNIASFKVDPALNKASPTGFTLVWEVDSYSTIIEYYLWIRQYYGRPATDEPDPLNTDPSASIWSKIVVPGDSSEGPIHNALYVVRGLTPSTVYEALVASRNRFGWSKLSAVLHFATEPGVGNTPSVVDYSDISPILEDIETEPQNISQAQIFGIYDFVDNNNCKRSCISQTLFVTALLLLYFRLCV